MPTKMTGRNIGVLVSLFIVFLFFSVVFHTCSGGVISPLPYRYLTSFRGKVVDADTGEPLAGAAVLAVYYMTAYSVAGEVGGVVDGQETLTDENGEFKIPTAMRWFFVVYRGYPDGWLEIFKPGYGAFPSHKRSEAVGVNKSWPPPKKYIVYELPKLKTIKERKENAVYRRSYDEIPYNRKKLYIKTINEECRELGIPLLYTPDEEGNK